MPVDNTAYNPLRGGIRIQCGETAGTIGLICKDKGSASLFLLTAFHVVRDPLLHGLGEFQILQPTGGRVVAQGRRYDLLDRLGAVRMPNLNKTVGANGPYEDYVAVRLMNGIEGLRRHIRDIGSVGEVVDPSHLEAGEAVRVRGGKMGQSAFGKIVTTAKTMTHGKATFKDMIVCSPSDEPWTSGDPTMTLTGDSGAAVVRKSDRALIGFLQGIDKTTGYSLVYPARRVMDNCGLEL